MHANPLRKRRKLYLRTRHSSAGHSQQVRLAQLVLREARVEANHVAHAPEARGRHLQLLGRDEPGYAFAAGRRREGAGVAGVKRNL